MTDDFEDRLRQRLTRLSEAVPVAHDPRTASLARRPVRAGTLAGSVGFGLVTVVLLLAAIVGLRPVVVGPGATASGPASASSQETVQTIVPDFVLTLTVPKPTWQTDEVISATASLRYTGATAVTLTVEGNGFFGFGVSDPAGTRMVGPLWEDSCVVMSAAPGQVWTKDFYKSGAGSSDFARQFLDDPQFHLPAGSWDVIVDVRVGMSGCGNQRAFSAAVPIEVTPVAAAPSNAPSATALPKPSGVVPVQGAWSSLSWSPSSIGLQEVWDVTSWDGALVAIGRTSSGLIATARSTDGVTWTMPDISSAAAFGTDAQALTLVPTRSRLLAWGTVGEPVCTGTGAGSTCGPVPQMIWVSTDGTTWSRIGSMAPFAGLEIHALADGPAGLLAVGGNPADKAETWSSRDDGATWQQLALPSSPFASAHLWTATSTPAGGYIVGGSFGPESTQSGGVLGPVHTHAALWWTQDLQTWTRVALTGGTSVELTHAGSTGFVAIGSPDGSKQAVAWESSDGRSWRQVGIGGSGQIPGATVLGDGTHLVSISFGTGNLEEIHGSLDGLTWTDLGVAEGPAWGDEAILLPGGILSLGEAGDASTPAWYGVAR